MGLFGFGKKKGGKEVIIKASSFSYKINGNLDCSDAIRKIKFKDTPFDKKIEVRFEPYEYDGEHAVEIYLNDLLIGELPGYQVDELKEDLNKPCELVEYPTVYGGDGGKRYGVSLKVRFKG